LSPTGNPGVKRPPEWGRKIGEALKGHGVSQEARSKISVGIIRAHEEGRCRGQRKGWTPGDDVRARMSEGHARRREEMGEEAFAEWAQDRARNGVKWQEQSSLERWVQAWFEQHGIEFVAHPRIGQYTVDFLVQGWLVVEVNGCWWHRCKQCGLKDDVRARFRDQRRYRSLRSRGYEVAVVWEHDLQEVMPG
jgi:very-short-patch-repair endonuclease